MARTALVFVCLMVVASTGCALRHRGAAATPAAEGRHPTAANEISVFVFTRAGATRVPTGDQVRRERVTKELVTLLEGRKHLTIAPSREGADVTVEVRSAASVFAPRDPQARFDPHALPVDVTAAGQTTRLSRAGAREDRTVRALAKTLDRWIQANSSKILSARPRPR